MENGFTFNVPGLKLSEDQIKQFGPRKVIRIELGIDYEIIDNARVDNYYVEYHFEEGSAFRLGLTKEDFENMQL